MLNMTGLAAMLATFFGVWFGHVMVRKVEASVQDIRWPMTVCIVLGLALEAGSLFANSAPVSAALGILGVTVLWDALEFVRQQKRIKIGHAPANPNNPRHARILAENNSATALDWLNRNPRGAAYTTEELKSIADGAK